MSLYYSIMLVMICRLFLFPWGLIYLGLVIGGVKRNNINANSIGIISVRMTTNLFAIPTISFIYDRSEG